MHTEACFHIHGTLSLSGIPHSSRLAEMGFQLHLPALEQSFCSLGHLLSKQFYNLVLVVCNELPLNVVQIICFCLTLAGTRASPGTLVCVLYLFPALILTYNLEVDEVTQSCNFTRLAWGLSSMALVGEGAEVCWIGFALSTCVIFAILSGSPYPESQKNQRQGQE